MCTHEIQILLAQGTNGIDDMFWYAPWNTTDVVQSCYETYHIKSRVTWAATNYGHAWIGRAGVNNIVFSNGMLDPWHGGGIWMQNLSHTLTAINTGYVGHHMDLFFSNPSFDPQSIVDARNYELKQIDIWLQQYWNGIHFSKKSL